MKKSLLSCIRIFPILFLILYTCGLSAAEFEVVSFTKDPSDLSAQKLPRKDINDEDCAIIKVRCDIVGLMFDTELGVSGLIEYKDGAYWLYVSPNESIVEVFRSGYPKFVYPIDLVIEPAAVYVMMLEIKEEKKPDVIQEEVVLVLEEKNDECSGTFIDQRDGQEYKMVEIGEQCWMAENLNFETLTSVCYKNMSENCEQYGRLYKWKSALKICPMGWHLPGKEEWDALLNNEDINNIAVNIKSGQGWHKGNNGSDELGFSVLPGGFSFPRGRFHFIEKRAYFWTSTAFNMYDSWTQIISFNKESIVQDNLDKDFKFSVRCVRD